MRYLYALCFGFLCVGCQSGGRPFDVSQARAIQKDVTTERELREKFGRPIGNNKKEYGTRELIWYYFDWSIVDGTKERNVLRAYVGTNGVVKDFSVEAKQKP